MKIKTWGLLLVVFASLLFAQTANENKTMKYVALGKDAVLDYLEKDARQHTGAKSGAYGLYTDDAGNSLLIIEGHIFRGQPQNGGFPASLNELRGAPLNENFVFGPGGIITEIEVIDKK